MSCWHLIHTKIRQEQRALEHLQRQGFDCFLPLVRSEKLHGGALQPVEEPLFPRCLFIRLSADLESHRTIHMTSGVSRLFNFGQTPVVISDELIASLRAQTDSAAGPEAAYSMARGEDRVIALLNGLSQPVETQTQTTGSSATAISVG